MAAKYLITGGCGFLGTNITATLLRRGHAVAVLDNLYRHGSAENLAWLRGQGDFQFLHCDIRNAGDIERAVREVRPSTVFHLAGQVAMTTSVDRPRFDFEVNAVGTLNLLEALRSNAPEAVLVYSSTNKVYGDLEQITYEECPTRWTTPDYPNGFDESVPFDARSPYGCSKGTAELYVRDYCRTFGIRGVVFRHSSIYGGRQFATYDQGWIGWFCLQAWNQATARARDPFTISGTGKQVRDVLHVDDAAACYLAAASEADRVAGEVFNIGGGVNNSLSLLELLDWLSQRLKVTLAYRKIEERSSDQKVFVADCDKAARLLNWRPTVSADEGLNRMVEWVAEMDSQ
jgi:CDP-paratose 2-epimerase